MTRSRTQTAKEANTSPVNIELETPSEEPTAAPVAQEKETIQTDVKAKLARKTDSEDVFVPANPVALEKAAEVVAEKDGFELTRGTSIGARLIARSRKLA
jgi:hypothetical protein